MKETGLDKVATLSVWLVFRLGEHCIARLPVFRSAARGACCIGGKVFV